jgi:pimeloyl-ACP methyl ester carboxylesterase
MSDRNASVLLRIADALEQKLSMPSLRWDFSGNGESEGRFRYGGYRREAQEIACAAGFSRARGFRVALLAGHSKGATSALVYAGGVAAEHDEDYDYGVVNVAGRFDVAEGVERRLGARALAALAEEGRVDRMPGRRRTSEAFEWTLYREDLEDRLSTDVGAFCEGARAKGRARVLSLHCEGDADVPAGEAARFHEALGGDAAGHRLVVLPGGDHSFRTREASEALVEEVVAWAEKAAEAAAG